MKGECENALDQSLEDMNVHASVYFGGEAMWHKILNE